MMDNFEDAVEKIKVVFKCKNHKEYVKRNYE